MGRTIGERGNSAPRRSLAAIGCQPHKQRDGVGYNKGMPDYLVRCGDLTFYVECKWATTKFYFSKISTAQRLWLATKPETSFLWLLLGDTIRSRTNPRRAYLIPWVEWLLIEGRFRAAKVKGMSNAQPKTPKAARHPGFTAKIALSRFALDWKGNKTWAFPAHNPIWDLLNKGDIYNG